MHIEYSESEVALKDIIAELTEENTRLLTRLEELESDVEDAENRAADDRESSEEATATLYKVQNLVSDIDYELRRIL